MATDEKTPDLGSIENPVKFEDQDFKTILEACLKSGKLFSDPTFPAEQKSIGMPEDPDPKNAIKWLRPKEIGQNAVFVEGTTGTTDICQGQLGNCWLLAALSCLTMHPSQLVKVVPPGQSLSQAYAGIFYFRLRRDSTGRADDWQLTLLRQACVGRGERSRHAGRESLWDRRQQAHGADTFSFVSFGYRIYGARNKLDLISATLTNSGLSMFWQYGEWVEVVVDDRLPVRQGRLLFSYSHTRNEYWSALVEKAYAKLIGCYGSLKGGSISEGMEDFTGGIAYSIRVSSRTPRVLWRSVTAALSRGSLLSCFIEADSYQEVGKVTAEGLIKGHAYAITDMEKVLNASDETLLLRLRNPWGFVEYRGPWSDSAKEWDDVDKAEKERIELIKREDGEFWISADDLSGLFDVVELCSVSPDTLTEENPFTSAVTSPSSSTWTISQHVGVWVPGSSAGGSRRYKRSFWKNPQFQLVLTERDQPDDDDEEEEEEEDSDGSDSDEMTPEEKRAQKQQQKSKRCTVLVELLQKNRRQKDKVHFLYIAFHVYKVPSDLQGACLTRCFFMRNSPVGRSGKYRAQRGVWRKLRLEPGRYTIVASTYRPNQCGEFFVRVFSKTGNTLGKNYFSCSFDLLPVMAAPVSPDDQMRVQKTFDEAAGPDDRVDAKELLELFNSALNKDYHLPLETCRQLIFGEDTKGRSSLSRKQTETLLSGLRHLQSVFFEFDEDSSGTMSPFELSAALQAVGMRCDGRMVELLSERFASGAVHMPFHSFVSCVTRLRRLFALYQSETSREVKDRGIDSWLHQFLTV